MKRLIDFIKSFFTYDGFIFMIEDKQYYCFISKHNQKYLSTNYREQYFYHKANHLGTFKYKWQISDKSLIATKKDFLCGFKDFPKEKSSKFLISFMNKITAFNSY